MTYQQMMDTLKSAADPKYAAYQMKIVSDTGYPMLFVRMADLRKIAKMVAKQDWKCMAESCKFSSYEEVLCICLAVAGANADLSERLDALELLLPKIDSWGMTDSIVPTLAIKPDQYREAWDFAERCIASDGEYVRRFGIVMLLDFFLIPEYLDSVVNTIISLRDKRYYVRMACAWLLAEIAVSDWSRIHRLLVCEKLDVVVHNMTIRKIRESLRISNDMKVAAAALKRKECKNV